MKLFWAMLVALTGLGAAAPEPKVADVAWVVSGEFCEPETVLSLPDDTLLVSNVCGFKEPESGFLTWLSGDGSVLDWRRVTGLDAPLGMALHEDRLYVIDSNRVEIFTWPGFERQGAIELDTAVANDVAVAPDGTLFVSDTAGHQVIRIAPDGSQSIWTGAARFTGANGIAVHDGFVYIGGSRLWRVSLESETVESVGPEWLADIDGIEFEADGTLQVTPVGGPLIRFRGRQDAEILAGDGISSANHGWSETSRLALIPTGYDNTVIAIRVSD